MWLESSAVALPSTLTLCTWMQWNRHQKVCRLLTENSAETTIRPAQLWPVAVKGSMIDLERGIPKFVCPLFRLQDTSRRPMEAVLRSSLWRSSATRPRSSTRSWLAPPFPPLPRSSPCSRWVHSSDKQIHDMGKRLPDPKMQAWR